MTRQEAVEELIAGVRRLQAEVERLEAELAEAREILSRRFRQADAKPALDVDAVAKEISVAWHNHCPSRTTVREAAAHVLRAHFTHTPTPPRDETLAAAVARVERETRWKCAARVREHMEWDIKDWNGLADRLERGE